MTRLPIQVDPATPLRTKIVATLGPASDTLERIRELLQAGVNVCRLNFSHGARERHEQTLGYVRRAAREMNAHVAVLGDLCGPKIRLNEVPEGVSLRVGQPIRFVRGAAPCTSDELTVNYDRFVDEVGIGQRIYIDDGLVRLLVTDRAEDVLICHCTVDGPISSRKGVNLPDTRLSLPALTPKDYEDARWAVAHQLDFLALSFARRPEDLSQLRALLAAESARLHVIVKIERVEALAHLDAFIAAADGIMIARGDLGVEMDVWQVPLVQKVISKKCREAGKPVIVATQMLQSMVAEPMPTRAEVSDVANAILDHVDATMLSGESASGKYPLESVQMMARVARTAEAYLDSSPAEEFLVPLEAQAAAASASVLGAVRAAQLLKPRLLAVWSTTGRTAGMVAQHRLRMPVIGLTHDAAVCRQLALVHGILPIRIEPISDPALLAQQLDDVLLARGLAQEGDLIVLITSTRAATVGATDTMVVHRVRTHSP